MRDEQVSELFDTWEEMPATAREIGLYEQERNRQAAFEAGFRTAERLAKIEVLEELRDKSEYKMNPEMYRFFTKKIEEIKDGK